MPVASVLSGRLTSRRGPRVTMITGLVLGAAGLLGLIVTAHGTPYWLLVLPMLAAGSGMALTMPAATTAVMDAAPDSRGGTAAGLINTARQVGGALGVAVAGSLVSGAAGVRARAASWRWPYAAARSCWVPSSPRPPWAGTGRATSRLARPIGIGAGRPRQEASAAWRRRPARACRTGTSSGGSRTWKSKPLMAV